MHADLAARMTQAGGPFELARDRADGSARFVRGPHTLPDLIALAARAADRPFLRKGARAYSLHQALEMAARLRTLLGAHVAIGQTIGLTINDPLDWTIAFLGLQGLGVSVALLPEEIGDRATAADRAECAALLCAPSQDASAPRALRLVFDGISLAAANSPRRLADASPTPPAATVAADVAVVAFTSGSTSKPKAVCITHENLVAGLRTMQLAAALAALRRATPAKRVAGGRARTLLLGDLSHIGGYGQLLGALIGGGEILFPLERTPEAVAAMVAGDRISAVMGASERLAWDLARLHGHHDLSSLVTLGVPGGAFEPEAFDKIAQAMPDLRRGASYGLTETSGAVTMASDEDLQRKPGTLGAPAPNADLQVRDDAGRVLGAGVPGWIWIRGPMVMAGYIGQETPIQDGWLRTGDKGWLDDEGFLFLIDRAAFLISIAGQDLASATIEALARAASGVAEAAVVQSSPDSAHAAVLFVAPLEAGGTMGVRAALDEAWPLVAPDIAVMEIAALPRTRSGKIDRQALRALLARGQVGPRASATGQSW